jgi:hypothetical protein
LGIVTKPAVLVGGPIGVVQHNLTKHFSIKKGINGKKAKEAEDDSAKAVKPGHDNERPSEPKGKVQDEGSQSPGTDSGEDEAQKILLENPTISGATLINMIKAKGLKIVPKEADSASSFSPAVRAGVKKESSLKIQSVRFLEGSNAKDSGVGYTRMRVVLIEEGMGNSNSAFYYNKDAINSCVALFEGKKIYADHPTRTEDETRPERSVRDVLGHYENVAVTESDSGQSQLEADVVIMPDQPFAWARALLRTAVEFSKKYPDKEFVGLSINASGDAEEQPIQSVLESAPEGAKLKIQEAIQAGIESLRVVSKIDDAVSCDLVTEAGAGGKVLNLIEQEKSMSKKVKAKESDDSKDLKKKAPAAADSKDAVNADAEEAEGNDAAQPSDGEHADEKQDIELIKKMIAKYMGDGDGQVKESEAQEAQGIAHECMKQALEMGMSKEEALKCAEAGMRAAKKLAAANESVEAESESKEEAEAVEAEAEAKESKEALEKKESNVIKMTARIALLESENLKLKTEKHLETLCVESGLPMAATKAFRTMESVKSAKTVAELDKIMKVFKEGFGHSSSGKADSMYSFVTTTEKTTNQNSSSGKALDFSDCKN